MWIKYQIHRSDWSRKFRQGSTRNVSLISFDSHLDNKDVTIYSMTHYPSYMLVSLRSKLFEFSLTDSFLECLRQRQKVVLHIPRVYISWRPPHPTESSTTSCRLFQGPQNHWMGIISHTTTWLAIPTHLICQFACIQSTFHSMKAHNRRIKSRSGDGSPHLGMWWTIVLHISWSTVKWWPFCLVLMCSFIIRYVYSKDRNTKKWAATTAVGIESDSIFILGADGYWCHSMRPPVRPSVRPERSYCSNSLRISASVLKCGEAMPSTI